MRIPVRYSPHIDRCHCLLTSVNSFHAYTFITHRQCTVKRSIYSIVYWVSFWNWQNVAGERTTAKYSICVHGKLWFWVYIFHLYGNWYTNTQRALHAPICMLWLQKKQRWCFCKCTLRTDWAPIVTCMLFWDILGTYECVDTVPCVVVIAACIVSWLHPTSSRGSWAAAIKLSCLPFVAMNWISLKGAYFPRPDGIRKICKSAECICMCLCIWKNNNILFSWNKNVKTKTQ